MSEYLSNKREKTIQNLTDWKNNLIQGRTNIFNAREEEDAALKNIDSQIEEVDKAIQLADLTPEEAFQTQYDVLYPYWTSINAMAISGNKSSQHFLQKTVDYERNAGIINDVSTTSEPTATSTVSMTFSANRSIQDKYPGVQSTLETIQIETSSDKASEVTALLKSVDEKIEQQFEGMWQTFRDETKDDRAKQAAHSMREVISILLQTLSPDSEVTQCTWFTPETKNGKPTQRQRAKYAMLGTTDENKLTDEDLTPIYELMDEIRDEYHKISSIAHARGDKDSDELLILLESYLTSAQNIICKMFDLRDKYYTP